MSAKAWCGQIGNARIGVARLRFTICRIVEDRCNEDRRKPFAVFSGESTLNRYFLNQGSRFVTLTM
jgi:hypothetical protein